MADLKQDIMKVLARAQDDIRTLIQANGINATGRTSASIHIKETDTGVYLVGGGEHTAPIPTLEIGRPGGGVPRGFYYIIRQWTRDKGLPFSTDRERNTFSYFVSRKIARQGTQRHTQPVDVYTSVATEAKRTLQQTIRAYIWANINIKAKRYGR